MSIIECSRFHTEISIIECSRLSLWISLPPFSALNYVNCYSPEVALMLIVLVFQKLVLANFYILLFPLMSLGFVYNYGARLQCLPVQSFILELKGWVLTRILKDASIHFSPVTQILLRTSQLLSLFSLYHLQRYKCCFHSACDHANLFTVKITHRKFNINAASWVSCLE